MILTLASSSERRKKILAECGINYRVFPAEVAEENNRDGCVAGTVVYNASLKAGWVSERLDGGVVLGADTLVFFENEIIGKPAGYSEAAGLFERFSGRCLKVYTGICVIDSCSGKKASGWEETGIRVKTIDKSEIDLYLEHLGPFDKSGGFSIEGLGSLVFDDIRGSYYNVMGLPMGKLAGVMKSAGLSIFSFMD